jgi:hypothetical protein
MDAKVLLSLAPWLVFSVVAERAGGGAVGIAAVLACAGSLVLAVYGSRHGGVKIIDAAGVVTFAVLSVIGFAGGPRVDEFLVHYGRGGAALVLAAVMAISAFTVPFTEQYARQAIDRQYWGSPIFRAKNKAISLLWAGVILVMAVCHLIAGALAATAVLPGHRPGNFVLNWAIPLLLILWAIRQTRRMADTDREDEPDPA